MLDMVGNTGDASRYGVSELLSTVGLPAQIVTGLRIARRDPVLPLPFRVGERGAAAIGAAGLAAAHLWRLRGGGPQEVSVDVARAAASLRSTAYVRFAGAEPPPAWDPVSGFYPVRDGRAISIHCNFPVHREAATRVLGTAADRDAMARASAGWDGAALEDAIHAAGGCAGLARTAAEWQAHPHSAAVAAQDLLTIERIGDAPPRPFPTGPQPLSGIRVLDLTRVLAGPSAGRMLAEFGADVLKVNAAHLPHSGWVEFDTGVGKLSATLDLRAPGDAARLRALAAEADVFAQSYRPGSLAGRGFSPATLAALRPGIVVTSLSAWGPTGPWAGRRGFDSIVQSVSGMAVRMGSRADPRLLPVSAIDYIAGTLMAFGTMAALARRATEGGSWHVRVALARVGRWITDAGEVEEAAWRACPITPSEADVAAFCTHSGTIRHLAPVAQLSATPSRWRRPPVPIGTHPAAWPLPETA